VVGVAHSVVVGVEVDHLEAEDLARLSVLGVVSHDRVDILDDALRLLVLLDILGVVLELSEEALAHAFVEGLLEQGVFLQDVHGRSRVAVDLSDDVRKHDAILFLRLVNQLVQDAILAHLESPGLDLPALLSVGVAGDSADLAALRGSLRDLALRAADGLLLAALLFELFPLLLLTLHLLLELLDLALLVLEHHV
jgi:hypothetical protein